MFHSLVVICAWYLCLSLPTMFVLAIWLHLAFCKSVLSDFFCEPYFTHNELIVLSVFPLNLYVTLAFIRAVVAPSTMLNRFGDNDIRAKVSPAIRWGSVLFLGLLFIGAAISLLLAGYGVLMICLNSI